MMFKRIPSWAIVLLLLILIVAVALWLRVVLPYNQVFVRTGWVTGVDACYYMRLVDNLMCAPDWRSSTPILNIPVAG
jgi:asparagine N-glycosylation enzyme membrane subunit Stt3